MRWCSEYVTWRAASFHSVKYRVASTRPVICRSPRVASVNVREIEPVGLRVDLEKGARLDRLLDQLLNVDGRRIAFLSDRSGRYECWSLNPDGSGQKIFAKGLRNAVGLALNPKTDTVWATVNGRDMLGDDLPPDVIVDLGTDGGDFGWPYCYGDRVPDPKFTKPGGNRCKNVIAPKVQIRAHSAPLGLAFMKGRSSRLSTGTTSSSHFTDHGIAAFRPDTKLCA